jgi:cytoplasmic iron level regulating protein YaaA (DUF328/UPF0246 family)
LNTIGLISCGKNKNGYKSMAKDLYVGELFKKARKYTEKNHDYWFILSALHGLLDPDKSIDPYDKTLLKATKNESIEWAEQVFEAIKNKYDTDTTIYIYAGSAYRKYLQPLLEQDGYAVFVPMQGLGIGQQLAWLKNKMESD